MDPLPDTQVNCVSNSSVDVSSVQCCCEDGSDSRTSLWPIIQSFLETVKVIHRCLLRHVYCVQEQVRHIYVFVVAWDAGPTDSETVLVHHLL